MRLNKRQVDIFFISAGILIVLGYFFLFQRPLNTKIKQFLSERKDLRESSLSIKTINQKLDQFNQKKLPLQQEIQSLQSDFSQTESLWDIVQNVDNLAEELGLKANLIHPEVKVQTDIYQHNSLFIELSGDFPAFYHFLSLLENNTPTLQASSLKVEAQSEKNTPLLAKIHFDLFTPSAFCVSKDIKF